MTIEDPSAPPGALVQALAGRCPACGRGHLFARGLTVAPACTACGLDLGFADAGDGPAVFVILLVGMVVVAGALVVEVRWSPPYLLHAVLWAPLAVILSIVGLRVAKAFLVGEQFRRRAGEGRIHAAGGDPAPPGPPPPS